ncbi:LysR family transcriptional regulator [Parashewanella tropica]|uniref:LysR family transcriptional regulator n=1 Tax=Parashewanella tropica TaxID=2547970 RepID=UPI001059CB8B|nr:LysR family transcriptional regulator [Parashewanella tropica]
MNVSFEQLKSMVVFAQVVEQGTLSAAAKQLGLSRAVVSYHIKKLESHLGLKLLNRSTRTISQTDAGKEYFQHCKIISTQASTANQHMENLKQEPIGLIKITCPVNIGLQVIVPALSQFRNLYPKIELDVRLSDKVENIIKEGFDLAIRGAPLIDSSLQATKLSTLETCLCASPEYLSKHSKPSHPTELNQHQWVIYNQSSNTLEISKGSRSYSIQIKGSIQTNNASARTAFVEGGHGLAKIPIYDAKEKIANGTLVQVLDDYKMKPIHVYGVFPPGNANAKKLRLLIDFLKRYFANHVR